MLSVWLKSFGVDEPTINAAAQMLRASGVETVTPGNTTLGLTVLSEAADVPVEWLRDASREATIILIVLSHDPLAAEQTWKLLAVGAADVLHWHQLPQRADDICARLERLDEIAQLLHAEELAQEVVGRSRNWRTALREVVEAGAFSQGSVLITGESGTGKELLAQLLHRVDRRKDKRDLVVVDCAAIVPELSGSEFFGHERGAFTGAIGPRDGAFALANGGTLFLDEVGELPLPLQAQLLRVIQEGQYKRVGSNVWQRTTFRLVCATNRDLEREVRNGAFRNDLYHRIAGWVCRVPPLRERREDILPLTAHFLSKLGPTGNSPPLEGSVQQYLVTRDYPGNVRDLRQLVARIWHRHAGGGAITPGDIPETDRPTRFSSWQEGGFEVVIGQALAIGAGLKGIRAAATETAFRMALAQQEGNVHRAAQMLAVTDRAVQLHLASRRMSLCAESSAGN